MKRRLRWSAVLGVIGSAALIVLLGVPGAGAKPDAQAKAETLPPNSNVVVGALPTNPQRIAVLPDFLLGDILVMGYKVVCGGAEGTNPPGSNAADWALAKADGVQAIPDNKAGEPLAACHPDEILDGDYDQSSNGSLDPAIAPTVFVETDDNPQLNTANQVVSDWKEDFLNVAIAIGGSAPQRARVVIATLDRRAAAIRGQVAGKTFSLIVNRSPSTFIAQATDAAATQQFVEDLGLKNFSLPSSTYPSGAPCNGGNVGSPPSPACNAAGPTGTGLTDEDLPDLDPVNMLFLIYSADDVGADIQTFESNPLFKAIPAVKDNRWAQTFRVGDDAEGVSLAYSAVDTAAGIKEYYTTLNGSDGGEADITLNPATRKACWSISPTAGKGKPAGKITLTTTPTPGSTVTLTSAPSYTNPESAAPGDPTWQTTPTTWETNGCTTVPATLVHAWVTSPTNVHLNYAGASARLKHGVPNPTYSAS